MLFRSLVPLVKEAVKARAGADQKALENSVKQMHAVLLGAENDEFIDLGSDPFEWDTDVDLDSLDDLQRDGDDLDEGATDPPRRTDRKVEVQVGRSVGDPRSDLAADGGRDE